MTPITDLNAVRAARDAEAHRRAVAAGHPSIARRCTTCDGKGFVLASDWYGDDWTGRTDADIPCPDCEGGGR